MRHQECAPVIDTISSIDKMKFKLKAKINRADGETIRQALRQLAAVRASAKGAEDGFMVEAEIEGPSAKELNRTLLSALRRVEKKTTLRAEWTSSDSTVERFFDYVLKRTRRD
jgi:hypothetical protein